MAEADEAVFSDNLTRLSKALMAPNWIPGILEQIDQGSPDSEQTGRAIQRTTGFGDGRGSYGGLKSGQRRVLYAKQSLVHGAEEQKVKGDTSSSG